MKSHEGIPGKEEIPKAPQEQERASVFQWLRERGLLVYMATALSTTAPLKHERLEAAEIPSTANWSEGIKALHDGALSDPVETGAFYMDDRMGGGKWVVVKEGETTGVSHTLGSIVKSVESELLKHPAKSIVLCDVHTHTVTSTEIGGRISKEQAQDMRRGKYGLASAPSAHDIDIGSFVKIQDALRHSSLGEKTTIELRNAVVDPAGITYYRPIKEQDLQNEFPDQLAEIKRRMAIVNELEKMVDSFLENLDNETLTRLQRLSKYAAFDTKNLSPEKIARLKRGYLKVSLFILQDGSKAIAQALFGSDAKAQKLYSDYSDQMLKFTVNIRTLDRARNDWVRKSITIPSRELRSTKEYKKLRAAYALNGVRIRFIPHEDIPNEPPCAGVDYKQ